MNDYIAEFVIDTCTKIMDSITNDDNIAMLNNTNLVLNLFDKKYLKQNNLTDLQKRINNTLTNEANMRILRMMQTIKTETDTRIEYYDEDRGSDNRLFYQQEMEEEMLNYQQEIRQAMAIIIKELSDDKEVDTD